MIVQLKHFIEWRPRYIVFLNQSNNYKINYKFSIFEMKSIYQIMPPDGCGVEVEHFGLK